MNNDNDLNLQSMTKLSGWLRYWWKEILDEITKNIQDLSLTHFKRLLILSN